jgi:hypothetical protein
MDERAQPDSVMWELSLRVAALEDNVAFLEVWCEEQQDALDRVGESVFWWEEDDEPEPVRLRIVDLRDEDGDDSEETEYQRKVRQLRVRIGRLRRGLRAGEGDDVLEGLGTAGAAADGTPAPAAGL